MYIHWISEMCGRFPRLAGICDTFVYLAAHPVWSSSHHLYRARLYAHLTNPAAPPWPPLTVPRPPLSRDGPPVSHAGRGLTEPAVPLSWRCSVRLHPSGGGVASARAGHVTRPARRRFRESRYFH